MKRRRRLQLHLGAGVLAETPDGIVAQLERHPYGDDARPVTVHVAPGVTRAQAARELRRLAVELERAAVGVPVESPGRKNGPAA